MPSTHRNRPARQRRAASGNGENKALSATAIQAPVPVYAAHELGSGVERIGDILRQRRQQRGDDLQQIADYLCIRKGFLVALENNAYDELPADAYVIGFLRSYAVFLGFDGADAINRYRGEMSGRRRKPALVLPTPIVEGRTPSGFIMIGAAVVAMLIYILWYGLSASDHISTTMQPPLPPPVTSTSAAPPATNSTAAAPIPGGIALASPPPTEPISAVSTVSNAQATLANAPAAPKAQGLAIPAPVAAVPPAATMPVADPAPNTHLVIRAEKESWVVVADGKGHAVFDHVMKPGDIFAVPDMEGLKLTTGNSGGIVLVLDGKDLPKLSRDSSILHDISLDIDKLKTGRPKAPAHE